MWCDPSWRWTVTNRNTKIKGVAVKPGSNKGRDYCFKEFKGLTFSSCLRWWKNKKIKLSSRGCNHLQPGIKNSFGPNRVHISWQWRGLFFSTMIDDRLTAGWDARIRRRRYLSISAASPQFNGSLERVQLRKVCPSYIYSLWVWPMIGWTSLTNLYKSISRVSHVLDETITAEQMCISLWQQTSWNH